MCAAPGAEAQLSCPGFLHEAISRRPCRRLGNRDRQRLRRQPEGRPQRAASAIGQRKGRKDMPLYEHVFLARQDLAQAQVDALAENATKIIEDNGGKVAKTETWGLRSLAYRIAKNRKAHYVMLDLDAPPAAVAQLERQSNINEAIIRFLTLRFDA